ncbi:MAG: response regulator transcription factor [Bacteroidales bacterium]|nr:response regulator transcription factor [Bacteroidales bacterium]
MQKLKVFIVEDELPAQKLLEKWISDIPELSLGGIYSDGFSALKAIQSEKPDLIFLDIEMPKLTGLEMLELLDHSPRIIFTTAYHEYAVKAFELEAVDYLLKPFSFDRFKLAVEKVLSAGSNSKANLEKAIPKLKNILENAQPLDRIVVKDGVEIFVIPTTDILYLEAQDDYVKIHTKNHSYLKLSALQTYEDNLSKQQFVRVHRSYLVNVSAISKIEPYNKDSNQLVLINGKNLKISRSGLSLLRKILFL